MISVDSSVSDIVFVSVDVETTGLHPQFDVIVEIGAVKFQGGRVLDEFSTLVSIDRTIPFEAQRVHGISNEMLVDQPHITDAMAALHTFVEGAAFVEHSFKAFDVGFLEAANRGPLEAPYINTCTLSRKLFPFHRSHSLAECCKRHQIVNDRAHRALSDARATAQLLMCLLEVCNVQYPRLEDLVRVAAVQRGGSVRGERGQTTRAIEARNYRARKRT